MRQDLLRVAHVSPPLAPPAPSCVPPPLPLPHTALVTHCPCHRTHAHELTPSPPLRLPPPLSCCQVLRERVGHLELLPCITMHAIRGERGGRLTLEAEPTRIVQDAPTAAPAASATPLRAAGAGGVAAAGAPVSSSAADGGVPGSGGGESTPPGAALPPRARMLRRAATVPLKLDQQNSGGSGGGSGGGVPTGDCSLPSQHEQTLRSLELIKLRLAFDVSRPDGAESNRYTISCSLNACLQIDLPTPWFVPRIAIEAAGSLLLKVGLKIGCDQLLKEMEWLEKHERRGRAHRLQSRSPSHSPR